MQTRNPNRSGRVVLWVCLLLLSAGAGLLLGYDFGVRLGGVWLGVMAAFNGAVFCTFLADALIQVVTNRSSRTQTSR